MRLFPVSVLAVVASAAFAQEFRATLAGEVTDPSGAAVAGAKVDAASIERNVLYESITNSAGRYYIQFLLPGKYTITVQKPGFRKFVREGIDLLAADKLAIDVKLELGAVADTVTVSDEVTLLQTETASRQAVIENRILEKWDPLESTCRHASLSIL